MLVKIGISLLPHKFEDRKSNSPFMSAASMMALDKIPEKLVKKAWEVCDYHSTD